MRIRQTLPALIGGDIVLSKKPADLEAQPRNLPTESSGAQAVPVFEQVHLQRAEKLPVFGRAVQLFYDDKKNFRGFDAHVVDPKLLKVEGLDGPQAEQIVREQLGFMAAASKRLTSSRPGIFLVDDAPERGRLAFEVSVQGGDQQQSIKVYVDSNTRSILDIR